ncbi:MAG: hypothetical protein HRU03_08375 [Nanoarchaeales archaeon]|nr:hypothetical protein [Nanoarchaeales archaeon]
MEQDINKISIKQRNEMMQKLPGHEGKLVKIIMLTGTNKNFKCLLKGRLEKVDKYSNVELKHLIRNPNTNSGYFKSNKGIPFVGDTAIISIQSIINGNILYDNSDNIFPNHENYNSTIENKKCISYQVSNNEKHKPQDLHNLIKEQSFGALD